MATIVHLSSEWVKTVYWISPSGIVMTIHQEGFLQDDRFEGYRKRR
jgi:hypothetical protein